MTDRRVRASTTRDLQALYRVGTVAGLSDGSLMERFVVGRDEAAFEALLARHGPMVLGVCRRRLREPGDVEDAFQATFLVLVQKAGTIRDPQRLSPWLYGVACRVAGRARAQAARRQARERPGDLEPAAEPDAGPERRELDAVLDEEVARLPEAYRSVLVLCDVEGRPHAEAARELAWPLGTVKSRLAQARVRLRARLMRRGLAPAALGSVAAPWPASARPAQPPQLVAATAQTVMRFTAGRTAAGGVVSATVSTLAEGVLKAMFLSRLKMIGGVLLTLGACALGAAVLAQPPGTKPGEEPPSALELQMRERLRLVKLLRDNASDRLKALGAKLDWEVVTINLVATQVKDDDLSLLVQYPNLQTLYLHHTEIGDAGLRHLSGVKSLTALDLFDTRVTDAGLQLVARSLPHLEWLELFDTGITDTGLDSLKGLRHLRHLDVRRTKATERSVAELRRSLPDLKVLHESLDER
jgi:RNA polymerase sigma factor (sigma-70 family)